MRMLLICFTLCRDIVRLIFIFAAFQFFPATQKEKYQAAKSLFHIRKDHPNKYKFRFPNTSAKTHVHNNYTVALPVCFSFFRYRPFLAFSALNHQNCVIVRDPLMHLFILRHSKNRCRNHIKLSQSQINGLVYTIRKVKRFSICHCV